MHRIVCHRVHYPGNNIILTPHTFVCRNRPPIITPQVIVVVPTVMVNTKYIKLKTSQSSKKFTPRFVGPFDVLNCVGWSAYRLKLPAHCRMHPVIHVSKLWKYCYDRKITATPPPPIVLEDEEYWRVEAVIGVRGKPPRQQFLVRWQGFDAMHDTWEFEAEPDACRDEINGFL
jgi:hypothetical protein